MGKREINRDEKRQLIVTTARHLMQVRDVSDFSMRTLAEVAGVSSQTGGHRRGHGHRLC